MSDINIRRSGVNTDDLLSWSASVLVAVIWLSCLFFALVIVNIYIAELFGGDLSNWNEALPDLYNENSIVSTVGMGTHFIMGTVILLLGGVQLIKRIRVNYPAVHRILGRIYVGASFLTALGGLTFIFITGTAGGVVMDIGFGIYGILMLVASIETIRHARARRWEKHNNWALRLYALGIGSWLYRVMYAVWGLVANDIGVVGAAGNFTGPVDYFMDFGFYIPSLIIVEMIIRSRRSESSTGLKIVTLVSTLVAIFFISYITFFAALEM